MPRSAEDQVADPASIVKRRRQTANASAAFAAKFETSEQRTAHFKELARRSAERRVVLSGAEAAALRDAYTLLRRFAERALPGPDDAPNIRAERARREGDRR